MVAGHAGHAYKLLTGRRPQEALRFLAALDPEGSVLSRQVLHSLLEQCTKKPNLVACRCAFSLMVDSGLDSTACIGDHAIRIFALCGSLIEATQVFLKLTSRTVYTWNAIISAHIKLGEVERALEFFNYMLMDGIDPDNFVLSCFLKACCILGDIRQGRMIHHYLIDANVKSDTVLDNTLLDLYAHCGSVGESCRLFNSIPSRDLVSWSTMIAAHVSNGDDIPALELYVRMKEDHVKSDDVVFLALLRASSNIGVLCYGRMVHNEIVKSGFETNIALGSSLVDVYAKCGSIYEANKMFEGLSHPSVVSWSAMIAGLAEHGHSHMAIKYFGGLQQVGIEADKVVFLSVLKACAGFEDTDAGRLVHVQVLEAGLEHDTVLGSTITDMYAKNGSLEDAHSVFNKLSSRDVVAWATIIGGFAQADQAATALALFRRMEQEGVEPSIPAFLSGLRACSNVGDIDQGLLMHDKIVRSAWESDGAIGSSLIDMYVKFGDVEGGRRVFDNLPHLNEVSYGAMIAGYAEQEEGFLALCLFNEMAMRALQLDNITFVYVIKACRNLGSIGYGRRVHHKLLQSGLERDLRIGNSLLEMYVKCRRLEEACRMFEKMPSRDVVSWGAMISGYAQLTNGALIGYYLNEMQKSGIKANETIFTSLLAACSHAGLIEVGCHHFTQMTAEHGILPSIEHYSCMIDLLGRSGCFLEAEKLIRTMPTAPNLITWTSLLTSCRAYCNPLLGKHCFDKFAQDDFDNGSGYLLISNTYANVDMWDEVAKVRELKSNVGAHKKPGRAWIEVNDMVSEFIVAASSECLPPKLQRLYQLNKTEGFVPMLGSVAE